MKINILLFVVFFIFSCSEKNNLEVSSGKVNSRALYFDFTGHCFLAFNIKLKNIFMVPYSGDRIAVDPDIFDINIQPAGNLIKLSDIELPPGEYAGIVFEVGFLDTVIQAPYYKSWREIDLINVDVAQEKGIPFSTFEVRLAEPFVITKDSTASLQINLNTKKAFPAMGLSAATPSVTFIPAFHLTVKGGGVAESKSGSVRGLKAKEKILENVDVATSKDMYIVTSLSETGFSAKRLEEVREITFSGNTLVTEDNIPLSFHDLMLGQNIYFTDEHVVSKAVSLTARVLARDTENQQLTIEPMMVNELAPLATLSDVQNKALRVIQLKRRRTVGQALDSSLTNEEMSALLLSPEPPIDLLLTFNGYLRAEKGFFESYFLRAEDLLELAWVMEAEEGITLTFGRDEADSLYALNATSEEKNVRPVIKIKNKAIILQTDIQYLRLSNDVNLMLQEVSSAEGTIVNVSTISTVISLLDELKNKEASIRRIAGYGSFIGDDFIATHLEVLHSMPVVVSKEGGGVDTKKVADDKEQTVIDAEGGQEKEMTSGGLSSAEMVSISVASGAAIFIGAALVFKFMRSYRKRTYPPGLSRSGGKGSDIDIRHPVVEEIVNEKVITDGTSLDDIERENTKKLFSKSAFILSENSPSLPGVILEDVIYDEVENVINKPDVDDPIYATPTLPVYDDSEVWDDDDFDGGGNWVKQEDGIERWISNGEDIDTHMKTREQIQLLLDVDPDNRDLLEILDLYYGLEPEGDDLNDYSVPFEPNKENAPENTFNEKFERIIEGVKAKNWGEEADQRGMKNIDSTAFFHKIRRNIDSGIPVSEPIYANLPVNRYLVEDGKNQQIPLETDERNTSFSNRRKK